MVFSEMVIDFSPRESTSSPVCILISDAIQSSGVYNRTREKEGERGEHS